MFVERGVRLKDGRVVPFEKVPSIKAMTDLNAKIVNSSEQRNVLDDYFYVSGEIARTTTFEKGRQDHLCREAEDKPWVSDPLLMDERYLAARIRDKGLIIFSACSHAGIINVLRDAAKTFGDIPIYAVFGGLHLVGALEKIIPDTVENLKSFNLKQIVPAHCTGWRAVHALLNTFGESIVVPSAVGSRYTF
jgi:7,8-dihydropterin-6-yl-methyl-4-(beta-D-ribofuranosyl)aminobenzene 5'-phosphate synthase